MAGAVLQMRPQKGSSVSRRYCTEKNLPEESSIVLDIANVMLPLSTNIHTLHAYTGTWHMKNTIHN